MNTEALTPSPVAELLSWAVFQDTDYEDSLRMSPANSTFCDDGIALHLISTILFCRRGTITGGFYMGQRRTWICLLGVALRQWEQRPEAGDHSLHGAVARGRPPRVRTDGAQVMWDESVFSPHLHTVNPTC